MIKLKFDLEEIKKRRIIFDVENEFQIEFLYNYYDKFIYLSILDKNGVYLLGHSRVVQNVDYLSLARIETTKQLRCIKINDYAEELDYITPENINVDYIFFLIEKED